MNLMLSIVVVVSVVRRTATSAASVTVFSVDCVIYSFLQGQ